MIVDDLERVREGLRTMLELADDLECMGEAANGLQAIQLAEQLEPDVVLMDVRMPAMDGLDATRLIKNRWPGVKIILLTIYGAYRKEALAAGADAFVSKADPPERLLEAIAKR